MKAASAARCITAVIMAPAPPIATVIMGSLLPQQHRSHDHGSGQRFGLGIACPAGMHHKDLP